ncbi:16S rRNA (guanine(966)-N(2))-methyltransferase RsmD [Thiopseudomonas denitrificans]|uniref:Ribosomal RNA small subunit methyltransferase D n=1 Tax=Thiopseudomonas denitrificans TaxID=1501432 RepID=A0A4R6U403_9GAMM|nr:16S rRNA (guanine(966)-N(2))-methyltransferase RsmD [Thiopseudomonas denitrificans]TDQ37784.1 16S rRNA m(2)G-966 methyltransferase [Thiopseudomonas denitrificans]
MARPVARGGKHAGSNQLRIIGGQWRSRRLSFPDAPGLRPTPDRVRETLYNWLAPHIDGARLLDCFAGSGALFLEGLSRGAGSGIALELERHAADSLRANLQLLQATQAEVTQTDSLRWLDRPADRQFDLVLLDPPFHRDLLQQACQLLEDNGWLAEQALVYTESEQPPSSLGLPARWQLHREKHTGQVYYALWTT